MYKYFSIKLKNDFSNFQNYQNEDGVPLNEIGPLSSINVIVGSNNSGKSRFMRELIKIKDYNFKVKNLDLEELNSKLIKLQEELKSISSQNNNVATFALSGYPELKPEALPIVLSNTYFNNDYFEMEPIKHILGVLKGLRDENYTIRSYRVGNNINPYQVAVKRIINNNLDLIDSVDKFLIEKIEYKKFYIPTLRNLNYLGTEDSHKDIDFYKLRIINKYQLNESDYNLSIFTGLDLYKTVRSMLLGDADQRKRISDYEKFLSNKLFEGKEISLIPKEKDDVLHIKIGSDEKAIYDLGDGVQSLIMLTFPLFEVEYGIFFIEEPEIHLHPALQRKLIEVFKEMNNHQYFITTHSNHLLDLTLDYADTSIFTFDKKNDKTIVKVVSQDDENILQLLGARNTSVFLSNSTIWVEGVTDRLYIRKYLELFQKDKDKKIQEDIDYSFVEYGGDNITHWSFLDQEETPLINIERLCGKSFLITDSDGDKNIDRKEKLKEVLGDRYLLLECNEIENTLSLRTIERVLRIYEKDENLSIPNFRSGFPHKKIKLGRFIETKIFPAGNFKRKGGYQTETGTVKGKVDFCKKSIDEMTYEEMSPIARTLAESVYNFVLSVKD